MLAHVLAILAAALRDVVQMVGFLLSVGIYLSPILFPMSLFPSAGAGCWLNPMTALVQGYQRVPYGACAACGVVVTLAAGCAGVGAECAGGARRDQFGRTGCGGASPGGDGPRRLNL